MQLFYNPFLENTVETFFFPLEESRHIVKILRKRKGDIVHITNGRGFMFKARILSADARKCQAQVVNGERTVPKRHKLHLAVAPTKMNERYEWFLEKATEIGVDEVTPIICDRSERKTVKLDRMKRIVQSAMKQSLQTFLPRLNAPMDYRDFLSHDLESLNFIAHCAPREKVELKHGAAPNKNITILIGPEGDFSSSELETALGRGYSPISLGNNRLRTETAAIVACATIAMLNG